MKITISRDGEVALQGATGEPIAMTVTEFKAIEPDFEHAPGCYEFWSPGKKYLSDGGNQLPSPYDRSPYLHPDRLAAYRAAIAAREQAAIDAEPPAPDWNGFNEWMRADASFAQACEVAADAGQEQAVQSFAAGLVEFINTGQIEMFAQAVTNLVAAGSVTAQDRNAWAIAAEGCDLPSTLVAAVRG
ncbi:MAG: hypothetical protein AAFO83_01735 [Cyanobacteria bacterium J06607_13]